MPTQGFTFRATVGYVTDPVDYLFTNPGDADIYPTTVGGFTMGWDNSGVQSRNRNSGVDARLAGMQFAYTNNDQVWRLDLTDLDGAREYTINGGMGDPNTTNATQYAEIRDNTTTRLTVNATAGASDELVDLGGNSRDINDDPDTFATQDITFTSTDFYLYLGDNSTIRGDINFLEFVWSDSGSALPLIMAYHG